MSKNIQESEVDITGVELSPGNPVACLGNGAQGFECCCDECDYYLACFSELVQKNKEEARYPNSTNENENTVSSGD